MKKFKKIAAQGDVLLRKVETLPEGLIPAKSENGKYIIAHSKTGHHHTVMEKNAQLLIDQTNEFIKYLVVNQDTTLEHDRSFHTHETLSLDAGIYKISNQREYTPQGYRKAQD